MTRSEDWNPLTRKEIFRSEDWDLVQLTLSANRSRMMFDVCERLFSVQCLCRFILNWIAFHGSTKSYPKKCKNFSFKGFRRFLLAPISQLILQNLFGRCEQFTIELTMDISSQQQRKEVIFQARFVKIMQGKT